MSELFYSLPAAVFPVLFVCFFVAMWLVVTLILSHLGGWQVLAQYFEYSCKIPKVKRKFRRIIVRRTRFLATNYGSVVTIGVDDQALYLKMGRIFRLGHAQLRIPHSEISVEQTSVLRQRYSILRFPGKTHIQIVMLTRNWDWVCENARDDSGA